MPSLIIQCRYIAQSYTGVRQDRSLRDELDWPPAPRLHQAFIASTLANLPDSLRTAFADKTLDALRWLETLPPPDVIASKLADDSGHRRALHVAMPHNSPAKGDFARYHPDLAPCSAPRPTTALCSPRIAGRTMHRSLSAMRNFIFPRCAKPPPNFVTSAAPRTEWNAMFTGTLTEFGSP